MSHRILIVGESESASRAILEQHGYHVTSARPDDAVAKAHETSPNLVLFHGAPNVARTLGAMHDVPMVFVGAKRDQVKDVRRRQIVAPHQPLINAVRGALAGIQ